MGADVLPMFGWQRSLQLKGLAGAVSTAFEGFGLCWW